MGGAPPAAAVAPGAAGGTKARRLNQPLAPRGACSSAAVSFCSARPHLLAQRDVSVIAIRGQLASHTSSSSPSCFCCRPSAVTRVMTGSPGWSTRLGTGAPAASHSAKHTRPSSSPCAEGSPP
eukprot:SAG25_NODE_5864_length_612_cov_0.884990_1_plen_122_part_10